MVRIGWRSVAAFLSGRDGAMVVDVGGTTNDVGSLVHGFPREANNVVAIGGVRTLLRMSDLLTMALGGGTIIDPATGTIGPRSVGYRITEKAPVFGGAFLIPDRLEGVSEVLRVAHAGVASALGAAMAQISGEVDQIFSDLSRDAALAEAQGIAERRAVEAGAEPGSLKVIEVEDIPIAYLPGGARRVRARVVGDVRERAAVA